MRPIRSISVLMPTWQGIEFLERALAALAAQKVALPWDFLAIDSGSTDGTWELLGKAAERFPVKLRRERIEQIEFDHGDTRNLLAARTKGDLLVYLTQDAIPRGTDWLARLAANFEDERVGAAYGRNVPRPDARLLTKIASASDPGYQAGRREVRSPPPDDYVRMNAHERRLLYNFNDVASALRRELWERHPFPRTWFGEDVLLARGVLEAGFTVVYDDEAAVEHSHDYTPEEVRARAKIDGRFNAEWLDRICVASKDDARVLEKRVLEDDARALKAEGLDDAELGAALVEAAQLRAAAFEGLYEGGRTSVRHAGTRMLAGAKLKVLYVVHGFPPETWAGTEVYTQNLARAIQARGHEVVVLTRSPDAERPDFSVSESRFQDLRVLRLVNRLAYRSLRDTWSDDRAEAAFRAVLAREKPDVVHFQHLIHLSGGLVAIAREEGIPTLLHLHDYWALCARVQLIRPDGVRCEENQGAGCFLCVKERWLDAIPSAKRAGKLLGQAAELALDLAGKQEYGELADRHAFLTDAYKSADLRVSPSKFLRAKHVETAGFDPHTTLYSDNGLATGHVRALAKSPDPQGRVRFGFVGSLVWYKGGALLLEAMKRLGDHKAVRDAVLNVFGAFEPEKDAHHAELKKLAGANVSSNIFFRGRFDNAKLAEVYAEIDVLVVPSVWFENSPITIHEAHLLRTPVVAAGIGGMAEFVRDGVDGLHFVAGDAEDLARVLARFVDEPELAQSLSKDFPRIKSIEEDAEATEFRYRQLACLAAARRPPGKPLVDVAGERSSARRGGAEPQGVDMLLLRAGTSAAAEYDVSAAAGERCTIRIEQFALGAEPELGLGLAIALDGDPIGEFPLFASHGKDRAETFELDVDLPRGARRLVLQPLALPGGRQSNARIRRVQVLRAAAAALSQVRA